MSEPENFLERWSRRKRAAIDQPAPENDEAPPQTADESQAPAPHENAAPLQTQSFDPASLPSIESIGAETDIRAFLQPGVPPELTRAALRRAWSADPAIRDFVGLVESGWDFNDPQAMAGFGSIDAGEVTRLLSQVVGELPAPAAEAPVETPSETVLSERPGQPLISSQTGGATVEPIEPSPTPSDVHRNVNDDAPQKDSNS